MNLVVKPLLPTLLLAKFVPPGVPVWQEAIGLASMFLALTLIVNSRAGRNVEEMFFDAVSEGWQRFGVRPMVGLFWFIVDLFRRLLQLIERLLYSVDEWLRFRSGQGRTMLLAKAGLGVGWFFVAYIIRFCVNLLIEPQLNPLKHIPWVSVSHKIMAPIWYEMGLTEILAQWMSPLMADGLTFIIVFGTPGIFGFLIWELKENWRLFAANRPKNSAARAGWLARRGPGAAVAAGLPFGHDPQAVRQAPPRRAEGAARRRSGRGPQASRAAAPRRSRLAPLRRAGVHRLVRGRPRLEPSSSAGGEIHLATNEAAVEVAMPGAVAGPLLIAFQLVDGRTHLALCGKLCAANLSDAARKVLRMALVNLLKTGGIEVLDLCGGEATADGAAQQWEIGAWVMPWPEWVARWETGRELQGEPRGEAGRSALGPASRDLTK